MQYLESFFWFVVAGLATARITSILYQEDIALPLRKLIGYDEETVQYPETFLGRLFDCYWCLSVWCSIPVLIVWAIYPYILLLPAISMVAIIVIKLSTITIQGL
jgi:hypothetical protein